MSDSVFLHQVIADCRKCCLVVWAQFNSNDAI